MHTIEAGPSAATLSPTNDNGYAPQTRGTPKDDWILPEAEYDHRGTTTLENSETNPSGAILSTTVPVGHIFSEPVRRNIIGDRTPDRAIRLLQQWECVVLAVHGDTVECEMHDLTDSSRAVEWSEIFLDEFSLFDRPLLVEGAVFYWSIGREESKTGTIRRYSELRVRRMPPLSKTRLHELAQEAAELSELFSK
ncbi:MAG: hypothetical protein JSS02_10450 [Planctomycetes bacterium]|nr:hypothetical protein [Planctomycetota bacterium]